MSVVFGVNGIPGSIRDLEERCGKQGERRFRRALLGLLLSLFVGCSREVADDPRNVILLVIDTLRADHLSSYGGTVATPHLDALAKSGVLFERAYSHIPTTGPSHSSLFTGLLPIDHGVRANTEILAEEHTTLAEILRGQGYRTGAFVSLGVLQRAYGFAQGFEVYDDRFPQQWFRPGDEISDAVLEWLPEQGPEPFFLWAHYSDPHEPYTPPDDDYPKVRLLLDGKLIGEALSNGYYLSFQVELAPGDNDLRFEIAEEWRGVTFIFRGFKARQEGVELELGPGWGKPVRSTESFVQVQLPAVARFRNTRDEPVIETVKFSFFKHLSRREARDSYAREVAYADREIGRLFAALTARGLWQSSILVFTSDHGEGLGDHGLVGHRHQLYDSLIRVPLIVAVPGRVPGEKVVSSPVRHVDVLPTVLDLLGLATPDGLPQRGISLLPLLQGGREDARRAVLAMTFQPSAHRELRGLILGGYKYIRTEPPSVVEELYQLSADPAESANLLAARPEVLAAMRRHLTAQLATALKGADAAEKAPLSEEELEQLRALGYVR